MQSYKKYLFNFELFDSLSPFSFEITRFYNTFQSKSRREVYEPHARHQWASAFSARDASQCFATHAQRKIQQT